MATATQYILTPCSESDTPHLVVMILDLTDEERDALISKCDDAERRGFPWGAIFWKEIKPSA